MPVVAADSARLIASAVAPDTGGVIQSSLELLVLNPEWRLVLDAYRQTARPAQSDDDPCAGWAPRLRALDGVPVEHLPRIHGKLIAHGLLQFQLTGRTTGVWYRVSSVGRNALDGRSYGDADSDLNAAA